MPMHFRDCRSALAQCARRADVYALATARARFGRSPRRFQIGNDLAFDAAPHHVPGMSALDFVADADTSRAQDAAVWIESKEVVGKVERQFRIPIRHPDMVDAATLSKLLQFTPTVRYAHGTDVIAFREQKLENRPPMGKYPRRVGFDLLVLCDIGGTSRQKFAVSPDFHQAESARAPSA